MSVLTPIGILSFPQLFAAKPRAPGGEAVFSCSILFDPQAQRHPNFRLLRAAADEVIDAQFGAGKSKDAAFMRGLRDPFRPCEEKEYTGYNIPGGLYISPWSKSRPGVIDAQRNELLAEDVWAGQMVRATVKAFAYSTSGNKGVSFALNNLQVCRTDTPRIDGRKSAKEEIPEYSDDEPF